MPSQNLLTGIYNATNENAHDDTNDDDAHADDQVVSASGIHSEDGFDDAESDDEEQDIEILCMKNAPNDQRIDSTMA